MTIMNMECGDVCLGTMYFGTRVAEREALRVMDAYAEAGGRLFDSANKYASWVEGFAGGESETLLGRWLKGQLRDRYVIVSKVGFAYGDVERGLRRAQIVSECEKSLRRLGVDCIDIYFAHAQDERTPVEETLAAFDDLLRAGKIRAVGASNYDAWRLEEAACTAGRFGLPAYVCLQQRYSLLQPVSGADFGTQKVLTPEHLDFCRRRGMAVMAYSPLLGGLYERTDFDLPVQYDARSNRGRLVMLRETARQAGCSPTRLVIGWLRAEGILPVIATGNAEHLYDNMRPLPTGVAEHFAARIRESDRFETKY